MSWLLRCPRCEASLGALDGGPCDADRRCPTCGCSLRSTNGVLDALSPEQPERVARFLEEYTAVREAEGRGSDDPAYYRRLPDVPPDDPFAWQWAVRARSFEVLRDEVLPHVVPAMTRAGGGPRGLTEGRGSVGSTADGRTADGGRRIDATFCAEVRPSSDDASAGVRGAVAVLDLGAGTGWLSHRLARLGHRPLAVDLSADLRDGLGAARHFDAVLPDPFPRLRADFDDLPLPDGCADLVLYNAALHYSADYRRTLAEARRVLRPRGTVVVIDSPVYSSRDAGEVMVAERKARFRERYGFASDALDSREYLTLDIIEKLDGWSWSAHEPWYGWRWALRPWLARLRGRREPSRFMLLVGRPTGTAVPVEGRS